MLHFSKPLYNLVCVRMLISIWISVGLQILLKCAALIGIGYDELGRHFRQVV